MADFVPRALGTFQTCRRGPAVSVPPASPDGRQTGENDANDPNRAYGRPISHRRSKRDCPVAPQTAVLPMDDDLISCLDTDRGGRECAGENSSDRWAQ